MILPLLVVLSGLITYPTVNGGARPDTGVSVLLVPLPLKAPPAHPSWAELLFTAGVRHATPDVTGRYRFANVTPGKYVVFIEAVSADVTSESAQLNFATCQAALPGFDRSDKAHCDVQTITAGDDIEVNWDER